MQTVLIVVAIAVVAFALLFVSKDGGALRFRFKLGKYFRGGGSGASIIKSKSSHGGAVAIDKTGRSASIAETDVKGDLRAEVSGSDGVRMRALTPETTNGPSIFGSTSGGAMFAVAITNSPGAQLVLDAHAPHDAEIDEVRALLKSRNPTEARVLLERKKRRDWDQMTPRQRYRVAANLGIACLQLGDDTAAIDAFAVAGDQLPEDHDAQAFRAWGLELRGNRNGALQLAGSLVKVHRNKLAVGVYLRCAPVDASVADLEGDCGDLKDEYDALVQLCIRTMNGRLFKKALEYAETLISKHSDSPDGHLLLGQALMHEELTKFQGTEPDVRVSLDKKRLEKADIALTRAIELAKAFGELAAGLATRGAAFFVRHQVRFMLGQREASDADLEEAWRVQPHDPQVLIGRALVIRRHSNALALKYLEEAARIGPDERVSFLRGEIQIAEGRVDEGIADLLTIVRANASFSVDAAATVIDAYATHGRFVEAESLLKENEQLPLATRKALASRLELVRGNRDSAAAHALEAQRALVTADTPSVRRLLAHQLQELGYNEQAFEVLDSFVVRGVDSPDFKSLLRAAYYAGKHDLVLDACSKFTEQGMSKRFYVSLECHILQVYDPSRAFPRLSQAIQEFPDDTELNFLYACVALRTGRMAEAAKALAPERIPSPQTTSSDIAAMVMRALLEIGRHDDAVAFAHAFLREHWGEESAHHLYVITLTNAPDARADQPETVVVDSAVCYKDQDGVESWVVIETETADAQLALNETTSNSALGSAFVGKRLGDRFVLATGIAPTSVEVVSIQNKYSYRLQDVMNNFQKRFPASEIVQSFKIPDDPIALVSIGSPLFRAAVERRDYVQSLTAAYGKGALTLWRLSQALGTNPISCQLGLSGSVGVRCAIPEQSPLQSAAEGLSVRAEVFVDTSAMATIVLVGLVAEISKLPWRLVTTNSCADVLRAFVNEMRDGRETGALGLGGGTVFITPRDPSFAATLGGRAEMLVGSLVIVDALALASVPSARREQLEQLFGRWGAEALACSAQSDRVLWTDDMSIAGLGARLGVVSASTQAIVGAAAARNAIAPSRDFEISTTLFTHGYEPLNAPDEFIRHLASTAGWQVAQMPLARLVEKMADMPSPDWLRVTRILVMEMMLNLELPQSRSAAMVSLLETTRNRSDRRALLRALVRSVRGMFALHVLRETEFLEIVETWAAQASI